MFFFGVRVELLFEHVLNQGIGPLSGGDMKTGTFGVTCVSKPPITWNMGHTPFESSSPPTAQSAGLSLEEIGAVGVALTPAIRSLALTLTLAACDGSDAAVGQGGDGDRRGAVHDPGHRVGARR